MNADDGLGTSSFNSGLHWTGGSAPSSETTISMPTLCCAPPRANSYTFGGDILTITSDSDTGGGTIGAFSLEFTPVPEPITLGLPALGSLAFACRRRA
jgi:hypothetical protein